MEQNQQPVAQRVTQAKDHIAQDRKMVAAQEPFGYFKAEPFGWRDCAETDEGAIALYEAPQPHADALDAVNIDRLGKALTKLGHAGWVSQEEAAADIPRWVNALTSCVLDIPEAAPQPQAVDQAPVAWRYQTPTGWHATTDAAAANRVSAHHPVEPLYASPQPQADARDAERWGSEPVTGTPFLQEEDQRLLDRFIETTEDDEGFDIGKEAIKRLAHLGVVESLGFGRYGVTVFGYWVHEHYWCQNPSLPLKTNLDRDADARAAIAAAKGKSK